MIKIKVQQLKLEDFEKFYQAAKKLILDQFIDYPPNVRNFYWRLSFRRKDLQEELLDDDEITIVAKDKEKIIGFLSAVFEVGGGLRIAWLIVDQNYRGQGVGGKLVERIEKIALNEKCHFVFLYTESGGAMDFYRKHGYRLVGEMKEAWCGRDEVVMQKNVSKPFEDNWN